jgi:NTP pyrophosphatase (non-canonical NTP hydrolase)
MELDEIISNLKLFLEERNWLKYSPNDVFIHLIEELGEIGKHLIFASGYKNEEQGHQKPNSEELSREFAQVFTLFLQLCILHDVDLEEAWVKEMEIMRERFSPIDNYK